MRPRIFSLPAFDIPGSPLSSALLLVVLALCVALWYGARFYRKRGTHGTRLLGYAAYVIAAAAIAARLLPGRHLGPFTLHTYGLMLAIAFLVALWVVARGARKDGLDVARITDLSIYALIAGLIGAKLAMVALDWRHYEGHFTWRDVWSLLQSGGVFYGGLIFALPVVWLYVKRHNLPVFRTADVLAVGLVLGQAIGRLGCFAAGCCYGSGCTSPWAVTFRAIEAWRTLGTPIDTPLHPTQLYESAAALVIFLLLSWLAPRKRFHGQIVALYMLAYASVRIAIEFFRGDPGRGMLFSGRVSTAQIVGVIVIIATLAVWPYLAKTQRVAPKSA